MTAGSFNKSPLYYEANWLRRIEPEKRLLRGKQYLALKRAMDLTLILLILPLIAPIFILCALLIKLESPGGPILFVQKRTGKDGQRFDMYKFRTMVPNAEALKKQLAHLNELQWPDFKITNDPRITMVGRFLRKTSLDELPQLLNVISGDMSLVGPRPTSFAPETYSLWQTVRLDVQPGITGLWQLYGRGEIEFVDRVLIDELYIERCCLWLDLQILLRTIPAVLKQRGAY
jgi:lipopolysaccharide/colanic/teichoic acid biosynthesis glycosyltransferase